MRGNDKPDQRMADRDDSISEIKERQDISETQKRKILGATAKEFFGL